MPRDAIAAARLLLQRAPWDSADEAFAALIPFDSPAEHGDYLKRATLAGEITSHRLVLDGRHVGNLWTKVEAYRFRELVIVAAICTAETPLSSFLNDAAESLARHERCPSIRFETIRAAAANYAASVCGFRMVGCVMRKTLPDVLQSLAESG